MSSYRQIHTKIWKDGWFLDLDTTDKLLFIYLFSNERSNLAGLYDVPLKVISFETEIPIEEITVSLDRFAQKGKVFYEDGWIWIPNLLRYNAQNITSPKIQTHLRNCLSDIPEIPLKLQWITAYNRIVDEEYRIHTVSSPIDTVPYQEQEQDTEQDTEQEGIGADAPPPSTTKRKPKAKVPPPSAVEVIRSATQLYPTKSLWPGIVEVVGEEQANLDRLKKTALAWIACGWNPRNVKGILEFYAKNEIPSTSGGARAGPTNEPASWAAIREYMAEEGIDGKP